FFNDFFDGVFPKPLLRETTHCMRTDIKESDNGYFLEIDVPGFAKEDIKISLENGYLTVEAKKEESNEKKESHYLRKERTFGSAARSFFVGEDVAEADVKAIYDKGVLTLFVPKQGTNVKEKKFITIG
ncbi:MAG: Hsp20/alpha crystallin family protein, partial [bacterium]